jgi:ribonuclease HI
VLIWGHKIKKISGSAKDTTNNQMELKAAIEAIKHVKKTVKIELYTDSQYVKNGITKWIINWKRNNWNNGKVKNKELWQELDDVASKHSIEWKWVKGHNGDKYNEIADELATEAIQEAR